MKARSIKDNILSCLSENTLFPIKLNNYDIKVSGDGFVYINKTNFSFNHNDSEDDFNIKKEYLLIYFYKY